MCYIEITPLNNEQHTLPTLVVSIRQIILFDGDDHTLNLPENTEKLDEIQARLPAIMNMQPTISGDVLLTQTLTDGRKLSVIATRDVCAPKNTINDAKIEIYTSTGFKQVLITNIKTMA